MLSDLRLFHTASIQSLQKDYDTMYLIKNNSALLVEILLKFCIAAVVIS